MEGRKWNGVFFSVFIILYFPAEKLEWKIVGNIPERSSKGLRYRQTILTGENQEGERIRTYFSWWREVQVVLNPTNFQAPFFSVAEKFTRLRCKGDLVRKKWQLRQQKGFPIFLFFCTGRVNMKFFQHDAVAADVKKVVKKGGESVWLFFAWCFLREWQACCSSQRKKGLREKELKKGPPPSRLFPKKVFC